MEIPQKAVICAARHFLSAYESAKSREPVDFGMVCQECPKFPDCGGKWMETAAPLFDAAEVHPFLFMPLPPEKGDSWNLSHP